MVKNTFTENNGITTWTAENEFKLKGFMKLMGAIMPGSFKKQSYKYMVYFKEFAEKQ